MSHMGETERMNLHGVAIGTRVVVRYLIEGGERATDALGTLTQRTETHLRVDTKTGPIDIPINDVVAGKSVPPAPQRKVR